MKKKLVQYSPAEGTGSKEGEMDENNPSSERNKGGPSTPSTPVMLTPITSGPRMTPFGKAIPTFSRPLITDNGPPCNASAAFHRPSLLPPLPSFTRAHPPPTPSVSTVYPPTNISKGLEEAKMEHAYVPPVNPLPPPPLPLPLPQQKSISPCTTTNSPTSSTARNDGGADAGADAKDGRNAKAVRKVSKIIAKKVESIEMDFSNDKLIAYLSENEKRPMHCREETGPVGVTKEMIVKANAGVEDARRRRVACTPTRFDFHKGEAMMEEGDFLLSNVSDLADICELMLRGKRWSSKEVIRAVDEMKDGVGKLIELMMMRMFEPVKFTDWNADDDDYYIAHYAGIACNWLPPGIIRMKRDSFVIGEALASYTQLFKIVCSHELKEILKGTNGLTAKEATTILRVDSLMSFLSIGNTSTTFATDKRDGELFITLKPYV